MCCQLLNLNKIPEGLTCTQVSKERNALSRQLNLKKQSMENPETGLLYEEKENFVLPLNMFEQLERMI